jgi:hypothetical protein
LSGPDGWVGVKYEFQICISNPDNVKPLSFKKVAGEFPPGISFVETGLVQGVPIAPGFFTVTIAVLSNNVELSRHDYNISISPSRVAFIDSNAPDAAVAAPAAPPEPPKPTAVSKPTQPPAKAGSKPTSPQPAQTSPKPAVQMTLDPADSDYPRLLQNYPQAAKYDYISFIAPARNQYDIEYFGGVKLVTHYADSHGTAGTGPPAIVSFTVGQNELVSGGELRGVVSRVEGFFPLSTGQSGLLSSIYLFGNAQLRLHSAQNLQPYTFAPTTTTPRYQKHCLWLHPAIAMSTASAWGLTW